MAKKIQISPTLAVAFDQRARGEETPYWVGTIFRLTGKTWARVGDFNNNGRGGTTIIHPLSIEQELEQMVHDADQTGEEVTDADQVLFWAEVIGYDYSATYEQFTLSDALNYIHLVDKTPPPPQFLAAEKKVLDLIAAKYAKAKSAKGKVILVIPRTFKGQRAMDILTYNTQNIDQIRQRATTEFGQFGIAMCPP